MAWKDVSVMSQRLEFVVLASADGANVSELCRRFGVSRKTGYKWLSRYAGWPSQLCCLGAEGTRCLTLSVRMRNSQSSFIRS
jgi:Homeodomain-like domain